MKLTLNKFYVKDIQFADESSYKDGVQSRYRPFLRYSD